jgi:hypothetical protein
MIPVAQTTPDNPKHLVSRGFRDRPRHPDYPTSIKLIALFIGKHRAPPIKHFD